LQLGLAIAGLALAAWGLLSLGKSFGIAPADRGLVLHGPYQYLRHPVYAGELLAVLGAIAGRWSVWNLAILLVLLLSVLARICWEERALSGYGGYARQVRWRLLPGIW
jgi:protein-S-isoprenylcysteine O-methyltransferase Ste14